ncbi:hypothetical protein NMG60_11002248 [Bertholletia excelsa]
MAGVFSRSNGNHKLGFRFLGLFGLLMMMLVQKGCAFQFKVGGSGSWGVPSSSRISYNHWAEKNRFSVGDTILFEYTANQDSVLLVSKENYENCNTSAPEAEYHDGRTVFQFNRSGPFYFISGVKDNCVKGEKLVVVVLADRSGASTSSLALGSVGSIGAFLGSYLLLAI